MSSDNLVKMANQIAHYFDSEPDHELAVKGVRQHLQSFWTPAMRQQLGEWVAANAGQGLDPKVVEALG
ncbi:NADH-dependent formate dehydrogenase delta subunit FdsD [Pseudomonas sp. GM84]|jgi:formate dehydrogenase subunit delta|uniref:formate dehydrogenase subunit delta n=1 Tax=Pseudomonas sp. GM84 TaxID=1144340 RepID=UPI00026F8226|nr:formate dehydrogenase subunit delta [Pseudomonas sp. GM84]EJN37751.1 NADH-dependent formate dehydrogenase delta subunit FdsD [Pseudomonas sp. GM84]